MDNFFPVLLTITIGLYVAELMFFGDQAFNVPDDADGLEVIATVVGNLIDFITFDIDGLPTWLPPVLFLLIGVPWGIIIIEASGALGQLLTVFGLVAGFFGSLF